MGLFDIFKKRKKMIDELFGELKYSTFKDKSENFYEGTIFLDSQQCGITIDADEDGPTNEQRRFFNDLKDKYPSIKSNLVSFLKDKLNGWTQDNMTLKFDEEFNLDGISLSIINEEPIEWSLILFSKKINHYITIDFVSWTPKESITIDG